jgi:multidrug efflux pump subunit AcrA (membrane-fusion protein)
MSKNTKHFSAAHLSALSAFICVLIFLTSCSQTPSSQTDATPTPLPTPVVPEKPEYVAERGIVVKQLEFTGRVSPVTEQELFFRSDGFVADVFAARGDEVQAGDVLAQLEISELQSQLENAELQLESAELNLSKAEQDNIDQLTDAQIQLENSELKLQQAQAGSASSSVVSADVNLKRAREREADAEREYNEALDRDWELEEVVDRYYDDWIRAQEDLRVAQAEYNQAVGQSSSSSYDIRLIENEVALNQLKVEQLERGIDAQLALDVEKARLDVQEIERKIADAQLIAPFDGVILSLNIKAGDSAQAFDAVMVLAEPDALEISADLGSEDLEQMSIGQVAAIQLRNRPEAALTGAVRQLPAAYSGSTISSDEDDKVRIAIDQADAALEIGELATVIIVLEEKADVVWLPPAALRSFQGRDFVVIKEADGQRRVDVRPGIESEDRVEIEAGVAEGDIVVGE